MIQRIGVAPRRRGLDIAEFQKHWGAEHGDVVTKLVGVRRYWQNHALLKDGEPLLPWPGFDACSEIEFDNMLAMDAAFTSPTYQDGVRKDEEFLVDKRIGGLMLAERVHLSGRIDMGGVRLLTFMRCAPQRTVAALHGALRAMPAATTAMARELFLALDDKAAAQRVSIFDAIDVQWFAGPQQAERYLVSAEAREHRHQFADLVRGTERLIARIRAIV
ncbi:MAG: EthD family reductase [Betaproteobacteria bacterium]|nr:EthD family reductase [Betaproteobacteria bacterium]